MPFGLTHTSFDGHLGRWTIVDGVTQNGCFPNVATLPSGRPVTSHRDETGRSLNCAVDFFHSDLNCDGLADNNDIDPFVLALLGR